MKALVVSLAMIGAALVPSIASAQTDAQWQAPPAGPYPAWPTYYTPPPMPDPRPPPRDTDPDLPGWHRGITAKLAAGVAYRGLYDLSIYAVDLHGALGGTLSRVALYGTFDGWFGKTAHGLTAWELSPGFEVEGWSGGFRAGGGFELGLMTIDRVTSNASVMDTGVGFQGNVSYDLWADRRSAVYLDAKLSGQLFFGGAINDVPIVWGPTILLGYRL